MVSRIFSRPHFALGIGRLEQPKDNRLPELRRRRRARENGVGYLFMAPWLVGFALLTAGPLIASLYLSFTKFNLLQPPEWDGLANYTKMFNDSRFWQSLSVTMIYVVVTVPVQLAFAGSSRLGVEGC